MSRQNSLSWKNNLRIYLGSSLLFLYIFFSILVFSSIIIFCCFFPFSIRYKASIIWITSVMWVAKICCGLSYQVEGLENLPKNQGYIVLSKHQSAWETLAMRLFLPKQTFVLKESLTWIPFAGWALATLKPIAIDRKNQHKALAMLVAQGTQRLAEGFVVIVFPEGTRVAPGENKKFNAGGALLAHQSGYPVIPLAHNAGEYWSRYSFLKYPGNIKVKIGPAIEAENKKVKEINSEAAAWIAQAMEKISNL